MREEVVISLSGPINAAAARDTQEQLLEKLSDDILELTINLEDVPTIDSAGLGVFVTVFKHMQKRGGKVNLTHVSPSIMGVFEQTHLDKLFLIDGRTAAEREQAETQKALAEAAAAPAVPGARTAVRAEPLPPIRARTRLSYLYIGLALSVVVLVGTQFMFYKHIRDDDLIPYLKSNATLVAAVLADRYRSAHQYPAAADELQLLLEQKTLNLKNVYTKLPLQIKAGQQGAGPGDLLYEGTGNGYKLRALNREGIPLRDKEGKEFLLTDRKAAGPG